MEPGLSFAPALWAHQRPQRGDGTNRRQEDEACYEEKSTFHIVYRERSHDVTPCYDASVPPSLRAPTAAATP